MNIVLWIVQIILALVFFMAGFMKLSQPREGLMERGMTFVEDLSPTMVRTIGLLEVLGALGLVLPGLTGILPWLTPLAAVGLTLTMIGALMLHYKRNEISSRNIMNLVLLTLALVVAYGRIVAVPIG